MSWSGRALSSQSGERALLDDVRERFGVRHAALVSTGRAGLTLLLRAMRRLAPAGRNEVVLPSYTCYSVAASVLKAGLRPRIVDIEPETLDFAPGELATTDFSKALAVIGTNLYGLPSDMPALVRLARQHGVYVIDDAAQAMGATIDQRPSGTWGDAGLYSLDKGKNVSAIDGGLVVTDSDAIAAAMTAEMAGLATPGAATSMVHVVKALAYFALLRPWLYGIPTRLPQLGLGRTVFTTDFPLERADPALAALGQVMLRRLDEFTAARRANAAALLAALSRSGGPAAITPRAGSTPAYLRLPILCADAAQRRLALAALLADGIGATASYPASLVDVPELRAHLVNPEARATGGRDVARRIVTLPTHPFVTPADVARAADAIERGTSTACAA